MLVTSYFLYTTFRRVLHFSFRDLWHEVICDNMTLIIIFFIPRVSELFTSCGGGLHDCVTAFHSKRNSDSIDKIRDLPSLCILHRELHPPPYVNSSETRSSNREDSPGSPHNSTSDLLNPPRNLPSPRLFPSTAFATLVVISLHVGCFTP